MKHVLSSLRQRCWLHYSGLGFILLTTAMACNSGGEGTTAKNPSAPALKAESAPDDDKAPDQFEVVFETSKGDVVVEVHRDWAPRGADRFYTLVKNGFYDNTKFFRVVPGFVAQFGIAANPDIHAKWNNAPLRDDPVRETNRRGTLTFATSGPNTRTSQLFINYVDSTRLDSMGFSPFGIVTKGMDLVDKINPEYGDQPDQKLIEQQGDKYLSKAFPRLDGIKIARIVPAPGTSPAEPKAEQPAEEAGKTTENSPEPAKPE